MPLMTDYQIEALRGMRNLFVATANNPRASHMIEDEADLLSEVHGAIEELFESEDKRKKSRELLSS